MRAPDAAPLGTAVGFLTRLPVGRGAAADPQALIRAAPLFPLVGAALGAALGGAAFALAGALPPLLCGALAVALELALTGALHADGLADSADGLAGRDREHALAIMRDHAVGTYGALALALSVLIKAAALGALADAGAVPAAAAAYALARAAPLPVAAALPYARPDAGTGHALSDGLGWPRAAAGSALAAAIALALVGVEALPMIAAAALATVAAGLLARRRLGGATGDVMGAATELAALLALLVAVVQAP
jgi:adenosylcobinamide-GDP ribazoletransferase